MGHRLARLMGATLALSVGMASLATAQAPGDLPGDVDLTLSLAAANGDSALLDAVAAAVADRPDLTLEIVDTATTLRPELGAEIRAAAEAAGGDLEIVPAAGPAGLALTPILLGSAGAAGVAAAAGAGGGGGGGDDSAVSPPPGDVVPQEPTDFPVGRFDFETAEYNRGGGLGMISASSAYARGLDGSGTTVAVIDSGLDVTHPEFAGRIAPGGFNFLVGSPNVTDFRGHGTHVAGIIAANRDGTVMHGVAPGARVLPLRIVNLDGSITLPSASLAAVTDYAVSNGASVLNNSWGIAGTSVTGLSTPVVIASFGPEIAAYRRAVANGAVVVFAAHNSSLANPSPRAGLPFHVPDLKSQWLAVVAVDQTGGIASYSNRCGVAAAWCLAAPGGSAGAGIVSTWPVGQYAFLAGTSMAAPHVSAAVAILRQLFPELSAAVIVQRLLETANNTRIYANAAIYGRGLLDLEAATRPVGEITVLTGATTADAGHALTNSSLQLGAAFGDGLRTSLRGVQLAVFDKHRATFLVDLEPLVAMADPSIDMRALLDRFGKASENRTASFGGTTVSLALQSDGAAVPGGSSGASVGELSLTTQVDDRTAVDASYNGNPALSFGLHGAGAIDRSALITKDAFASPFLSFDDDSISVGATSEIPGLGSLRIGSFMGSNDDQDGDAFGTAAELMVKPTENSSLALQLGVVSEESGFLGTDSSGALGFAEDTPTFFTGLSGKLDLTDDLSLVGSIHAGISRPQPLSNSLFSGVSTIRSQAFSLGLVGKDLITEGDGFGVLLHQPLRVSDGSADLAITTGRDAAGTLWSTQFSADLEPSGRELDLELFYKLPLGEDSALTASAALRHEPGHIAGADNEGVFAIRFRHKF